MNSEAVKRLVATVEALYGQFLDLDELKPSHWRPVLQALVAMEREQQDDPPMAVTGSVNVTVNQPPAEQAAVPAPEPEAERPYRDDDGDNLERQRQASIIKDLKQRIAALEAELRESEAKLSGCQHAIQDITAVNTKLEAELRAAREVQTFDSVWTQHRDGECAKDCLLCRLEQRVVDREAKATALRSADRFADGYVKAIEDATVAICIECRDGVGFLPSGNHYAGVPCKAQSIRALKSPAATAAPIKGDTNDSN